MAYLVGLPKWFCSSHSVSIELLSVWEIWVQKRLAASLSCKREWNGSHSACLGKLTLLPRNHYFFPNSLLGNHLFLSKPCPKLLGSYSVTWVVSCALTGMLPLTPMASRRICPPSFPLFWNLSCTENHKNFYESERATFNLWVNILQVISLCKEKI